MCQEVAIVGAGQVVNDEHLPAWKQVGSAKVIAVCDINEDTARSTAARWKVPRYYTQFDELLKHEKPFIVDICTPPATHLALTIQALEAGCNVILEKPMVMSLDDNEKILKAYKERKDKSLEIGVIYSQLFKPQISKLLTKVKAGEIGDVIQVEYKAFDTQDELMMADPNHWCHSLPAGRYGEGLIHPIYILYRLLGNLEIKSIWVTKRGPHSWAAYDEVFITFEAGKSFATVYNSHNSPQLNLPVMIVYGTKSQLKYEGYNLTLSTRRHATKGTINKAISVLDEVYQLLGTLSINFFKKMIPGRSKTKHEIYFNLFLESLVNNKELPLTLEEAYEANKIYLNVIGELEKLKPWKQNT